MDLNLKNNRVLVNLDNGGIYHHITKKLNTEGAIPFVVDEQNDCEKIHHKIKNLNTLINIKDNCKTISNIRFFQSFYDANSIADNFIIINIGTNKTLKMKASAYKNDLLSTGNNTDVLEQKNNVKSINIVYPDIPSNIKNNNTLYNTEEYTHSTIQQIVDSVAFLISNKENLTNDQVIFIDNGLHLL